MAEKCIINSITLVYYVMSENTTTAKTKTLYSYWKQKGVNNLFKKKALPVYVSYT